MFLDSLDNSNKVRNHGIGEALELLWGEAASVLSWLS